MGLIEIALLINIFAMQIVYYGTKDKTYRVEMSYFMLWQSGSFIAVLLMYLAWGAGLLDKGSTLPMLKALLAGCSLVSSYYSIRLIKEVKRWSR